MAYHIDQLTKDLELTKAWLEDETRRMEATNDEHLKGLLKIRINMYSRNIKELETAIATFETDPGFIKKEEEKP